jgi:hypothetical protein
MTAFADEGGIQGVLVVEPVQSLPLVDFAPREAPRGAGCQDSRMDDSDDPPGVERLRDLAAGWWLGPSDDLDDEGPWEAVDALVQADSDALPAVIRALADTAPEGGLSYIGVSVVEDLEILAEVQHRPSRTVAHLTAAGLSREELFEILSGPWTHYLVDLDVRSAFAGIFSERQFAWLLDDAAPSRRDPEVRTLPDGEGLRQSRGSTEFSRWLLGDAGADEGDGSIA